MMCFWLNHAISQCIVLPNNARGGVPREQKMLKGHLPRVIYHRVYSVYEDKPRGVSGGGGTAPGDLGALHSRRILTDKTAKERKREEDERTRKDKVRVLNLASGTRALGPGTRHTKPEARDPKPVSRSRT